MFKQLRHRLLLMNLTFITILMLISFSSIYIMTYKTIHSDIKQELFRISDFKKDKPKPNDAKENLLEDRTEGPLQDAFQFPERRVSFIIETDLEGTLNSTFSFFESDEHFYTEALTIAKENGQLSGEFTFDGTKWEYLKRERPDGYTYAFLDITTFQNLLDRLVYTFLMVSVAMIFLILFISNYLTNRSIQPIKEAFDKQKQFISDASHELKTPLAVIGTNVDLLLSNQPSKDSGDTKWLTYIKSEVQRMTTLTKDLLYLTQVEFSKESQLVKTHFNLSDRIENQLLGLEAVAFEKNLQLDYTIEPDIILYGNAEQLAQVVMILLDNAIKYTSSQGQIHLSLNRSAHHASLIVTNTGEGIPPDEVLRIFDRFYRIDKARSRDSGSYGLGLSIAQAIVIQHGGKIFCDSTLGKETSFTVRLKLNS